MKRSPTRFATMLLCAGMMLACAQAADKPNFEVRLVVPCGAADKPLPLRDGKESLCLSPNLIMDASNIVSAGWTLKGPWPHDSHEHAFDAIIAACPTEKVETAKCSKSLALRFDDAAAARLAVAAKTHIGERIGVVVNGELVFAPVITGPISGHAMQIDGLTDEEIDTVIRQLNAGAAKP